MVTTESPQHKPHTISPERLAWITMLGGLVLFVLACIGLIAFSRWLVFESPTDMDVTLHVGQGTVGILAPDSTDERAIRSSTSVDSGERLSTDNLSQGYLAFSDPYTGDIVATVMLRNDSTATLSKANRPRFNLSDNPYTLRVQNVIGNVEVWVSSGMERGITLEISTPLGTVAIAEKGNLLISTTPNTLTITARDGSAVVYGPNNTRQQLNADMRATVHQNNPEITVGPGPLDLLPYSTFGTEWPKEWICAHQPDPGFPNAPGGDFEYAMADGRPMIHLWRYDSGPTPAKTGCFQRMGNNGGGLNIMQYESLRLRVTMKVEHQSLSACGIAGTECGIMLKMTYLDQNGAERIWYHGFYGNYRPSEGLRICNSCWEPHEQVNQGAWYTYESGDLLSEWPQDLRPGQIKEIEFYASGHEYDVMLNEFALIATTADTQDAASTTSTP